jgi:hypothetical protein
LCEKIFWATYNDADKSWLDDGVIELRHYQTGTANAVLSANEEQRCHAKLYELATGTLK